MRYDGVLEAEGDNIVINPIRERGILEESDYSDYDSDYEENGYEDSDYEDSGGEGDDSRTQPAESSILERMA